MTMFFYCCLSVEDQKPRQFFDQRDAGLYICRWPDKAPEDPLPYSSEVVLFELFN